MALFLRYIMFLLLVMGITAPTLKAAQPTTIRILVLGDSLVAGYGLSEAEAYPAQLESILRKKYPHIEFVNGGVSGDTAADGLDRLAWALNPDITAVILELGANDALRGLPPAQTEQALEALLQQLQARGLPVLLAGMQAPPNMGSAYVQEFNAIYPRLAQKYNTLYMPFFLDKVAGQPLLNQADGMHPTAQGVETIVNESLPLVEALITLSQK